ncbi:MAG: HEAT repeat domain-containing protein [bacterium]
MSEEMDQGDPEQNEPELDVPETEEVLDEEPELDEWLSWGNFARLFIVPLVIVIVAVVIYGFFQVMLRDPRTINDYLSQMKEGTERQRWRAAAELAKAVKRRGRQKEMTLSEVRRIIKLFKNSEQAKTRRFLAHVLAKIPSKDSIQALEGALDDPDKGVRSAAALALGQLNSQKSASKIARLLDDKEPGVRLIAAGVLGSLGNKSVTEELKKTLNDPAEDVRWNGAIALARLGNESGRDLILDNLELASRRKLKKRYELSTAQRRRLLIGTIRAVKELDMSEARKYLKQIYQKDPDPEIRKKSLGALQKLGSKS